MNDINSNDIIMLSHGGGGVRTQALIRDIILRHLGNPILERLDDSACLTIPESELAFTTDSYVVNPIFFPGGDIGRLAACGTINDLAMQGAEPRYLSLGLILEEGLPLRDLDRVIRSLAEVARETGVQIVTGDTKVVERGKGNGIFINTSGIGVRFPGTDVHVGNARPGDAVIITGTLGDHGAAIMSKRLNLDSDLVSDVAPLWNLMAPLLRLPARPSYARHSGLREGGSAPAKAGEIPSLHCLRDPTRGGLAAAACDIAASSRVCIRLNEDALPVRKEVQGICQLLGLDPLNVANEGKALVICPETEADHILRVLRAHPLGRDAAVIGAVTADPAGKALLKTCAGGERIIQIPLGEDLPRIC